MAREWLAVYTAITAKPHYRLLTPAAKGALFHVFVQAGLADPEATWADPADLAAILELDGFPASALDELKVHRWIVPGGDGSLIVRDWDRYQLAASAAIQRRWEASRKAEWRRTKRAEAARPTSPDSDTTGDDMGTGHVPDTRGTNGRVAPLWTSFDERWAPFLEAWRERFTYPPSGEKDDPRSQRAILWRVVDAYPMKAADWCRAAPVGLDNYDLTRYVVRRYHDERHGQPGAAVQV